MLETRLLEQTKLATEKTATDLSQAEFDVKVLEFLGLLSALVKSDLACAGCLGLLMPYLQVPSRRVTS